MGFGLFRVALGLGEGSNFPACNKAAAEWFEPEERANVMGIVSAGTNFAAIIGPPIFILIALKLGWQACFAIMGGLGFLWLPVWFSAYKVPEQETGAAREAPKLPMRAVLKYREAWGYAWGKFLTDPVWWFYLFWLPTYLTDVRHFSPGQRGTALTVIYAISGVGTLAGGMFSGYLIRRGWAVGRARKVTMLVCAVLMPVSGLGVIVGNVQLAILLFGLATAAHGAWMANLFTTPADVFPKEAVGSANGFGVCVGALGGALFSGIIPGIVIPRVGYVPVLLAMSGFHLVAWFVVDRLMGKWEMISLAGIAQRPVPVASRA